MSATLQDILDQALDSNGDPISGAKLNFYLTGTTTRKNTYSDSALTTPNANPVVADSAGRFAQIFLDSGSYKVVLTDADDVTIATFESLTADATELSVTATGGTTALSLETAFSAVLDARFWGVVADGTTDNRAALQAVADYATSLGGAVIDLPYGVIGVSGPVYITSYTVLRGKHKYLTYIKALNSATFTASEAVIMTKDFTQDADLWEWYEPYPTGLHMHVEIRDLSIDCNRTNVANANGIMIYGSWQFQNIGVFSPAGHGIWTECGSTGSSTSGDNFHDFLNMHESTGFNIEVCNPGKHGWWYRGPNDSYIDDVQIKAPGWACFYHDQGSTISTGGLKIGTLHGYVPVCAHTEAYGFVFKSKMQADFIYLDTCLKGGALITGNGSGCRVDKFESLKNNNNGGVGGGSYYALKIDAAAAYVGDFRSTQTTGITSGTNGGDLEITSNGTQSVIDNVYIYGGDAPTVSGTAVTISGDGSRINSGIIRNYTPSGSKGIVLAASRCKVDTRIDNIHTGFDYQNSGEGANDIVLSITNCTTDVSAAASYAKSDTYRYIIDSAPFNESQAGNLSLYALNFIKTDIAYAASITPNADSATWIAVGTLTGNITVNAPSNPTTGDVLFFEFLQDTTAGRTITWNAVFKVAALGTGTNSQRLAVGFRYNGTTWMQLGASSGWL